MASISPTEFSMALSSDLNLAQIIDKNVPEIAINFKTGEYLFTTPVMVKAGRIAAKNILITTVSGLMIGGIVGRVTASLGILAGVKNGMAMGAGMGAAAGTSYVILKGHLRIQEIDREISQINVNGATIIDRFFRSVVLEEIEQGVPFYCPLSNRLMHIPVSTGCNAQRNEKGDIMIDSYGEVR